METKSQKLMNQPSFENLDKEELVLSLHNSRQETFKYVNKFLEAEEKWTFINVLLKKLNAVKHKQELCKTVCEGFLKLTNSKVCYCALFNHDTSSVEFAKAAYEDNFHDKKKLTQYVDKINIKCCNFLTKYNNTEDIFNYFEQQSREETLVLPIVYSKMFLGYFLLHKHDKNFYKDNIHFMNIFPEHIALILENISLYQESEKRNKRKIEFLAGISHEFKTPLNSIIGFADILKSKIKHVEYSMGNEIELGKHREYSKYLDNILQSSKHLRTLIEDILDVSKSQYHSLELNYSLFSPKKEIIKIISSIEQMIQEKNIELSYTLTDLEISADVKRFRQLIYNLASNAIKFNKEGGKISILTYIQDDKFFFEIIDTGDGISKRNYEKIFDFFSQVNRSQLKRQLGSGVGLAICKIITDAHKGQINFKSQLKKGSCFWFSLPINNNK